MEERIAALEERVGALERQLQSASDPATVADEIEKRLTPQAER